MRRGAAMGRCGWALRLLLTVVALVGGVGVAAAQRWGVQTDGVRVPELAAPGTAKAVVLFFVASDCPVSNRTFPEMRRLRELFAGRGVRTWYVYPNRYEQAAGVAAHQQAFDAAGQALLDPDGALVRLAHAVATPEIAVLVPKGNAWQPAYVGRIDNRYVRLGLERPAATEHFGENSIRAVLAGETPQPDTGTPVGCAIASAGVR